MYAGFLGNIIRGLYVGWTIRRDIDDSQLLRAQDLGFAGGMDAQDYVSRESGLGYTVMVAQMTL